MSDVTPATARRAVFLSYASQDAEAAIRICGALRSAGVEVWLDQSELVGGDAWDAKIRGQIGACALFVPIVSVNTQARQEGYFRLEWKLAEDRSHLMSKGKAFIVPVSIDGTSEREAEVPDAFLRVQWTKLPGGETTPAFVARVQKILGGGSAAHPAVASAMPVPSAAVPLARSGSLRWMATTTAAVALGMVAFVLLRSPPKETKEAPPAAKPVVETRAAPPVDPKSIAILPFDNISEDKAANAFFADGMHEDILTNLGVVRELHVTSRTSVMQYRATTKPLRQIGAELGVAYVLEGSVRRAGNTVRVTGQLINARTDEHVWAKSYDRDLTATGVFAIQSELSQEIVAALSAALSPQEKALLENRPTTNLAAYDLFLKARANVIGNSSDLTRAQQEDLLVEAVKLDPAFAQAWGYLARSGVLMFFENNDSSPQGLAKAQAAIETAVRLAPGDPEVIESQGDFYYYGYRDYARAAEHYQRLLVLRPNSGSALAKISYLYRRQGRWAEALERGRKAVQLEPRDLSICDGFKETLQMLRRYDEATAEARRAVDLAPGDLFVAERFYRLPFFARGSTRQMDEWLAAQKPAAADERKLLFIRRNWAELRGDWALAVEIARQHPYLDPWDEPHWWQDATTVYYLIGHDELAAARTQAKKIIPELNLVVEQQPANASLLINLGFLYALDGDKESALRCGRKAMQLVPESTDANTGPVVSAGYAQILAWTGDKEGALAELARLMRIPKGTDGNSVNVHAARVDPGWLPLRGDPRFEALLNDPKNNAPLL